MMTIQKIYIKILTNGAVRVDYDAPEINLKTQFNYNTKKPKPDEGDPRPTAEFDAAELGPVGRVVDLKMLI